MYHETEDSETVVDGDEDYILICPLLAVELDLIAPASCICAAVDPHTPGISVSTPWTFPPSTLTMVGSEELPHPMRRDAAAMNAMNFFIIRD